MWLVSRPCCSPSLASNRGPAFSLPLSCSLCAVFLGEVNASNCEWCQITLVNVPVIHGRHAPPIYGYDNPVKVHVTGVFKPGEAVRLYVNGQLMAEDTTNVPDAIGQTGLFKIGARSDNTTQGFWDGQIDDLRITGRALSASEIQSLSSWPVTAVTRVHQIRKGTDSQNPRHPRLSASPQTGPALW